MPASNLDIKKIANNLKPKQIELLVTLGVVLVLLLVAKKAYDIPMAKVASLNQQIRDEDEKRLTLDRIVVLNERLKKYKDRGWDSPDFDTMVERVSTVGQSAGLKIRTIMPLEKKTESNVLFIPFSVNCEGTFRQVLRFLRTMEHEKKVFRFRELILTPMGGDQNDEMQLTIAVTGEAVHFNK